jgi:hypothetical protein
VAKEVHHIKALEAGVKGNTGTESVIYTRAHHNLILVG